MSVFECVCVGAVRARNVIYSTLRLLGAPFHTAVSTYWTVLCRCRRACVFHIVYICMRGAYTQHTAQPHKHTHETIHRAALSLSHPIFLYLSFTNQITISFMSIPFIVHGLYVCFSPRGPPINTHTHTHPHITHTHLSVSFPNKTTSNIFSLATVPSLSLYWCLFFLRPIVNLTTLFL